jgi:hypothetical protein
MWMSVDVPGAGETKEGVFFFGSGFAYAVKKGYFAAVVEAGYQEGGHCVVVLIACGGFAALDFFYVQGETTMMSFQVLVWQELPMCALHSTLSVQSMHQLQPSKIRYLSPEL